MRCAVVLLALAAFGAAIPQQLKQRAADQEFLKKQQDCILLLQQINHQIPDEQLQILGTGYDIENNYHQYENPILVKYYVGAVRAGLVQPKGTTFSNSISHLRKEVSLLHRILLGANNYQTFLKTAAWARVNVNEGQFVKAFIGAVFQRQDTQGIILPPLYEVVPQYYFDSRIIQEAQDVSTQQQQEGGQITYVQNGKINVVIPVNYSAHLPHGEHQLNYFTQDIGLANYYGFVNLAGYLLPHGQQTPMQYQQQVNTISQNQEGHIGQGSRYWYLHQQLLAHYELNRLGNGLGPIHYTDYNHVDAPYQPHLRYTNGLEFPGRPENIQLEPVRHRLVHTVKTLEQRLINAIDAGHVLTPQGSFLSLYQPQGLNILGELIEGTGRSVNPRYYGSLQAAARQLLGNAPEVQHIYDYTPSVLELGQVAVRDPAFYQLYQKIIKLFTHYQNSLPAYQYNDLLLPGVTIQNVEISQLVTFFNDYFVDLDEATVKPVTRQHQQQQQQQNTAQHIQAHLKRLDHKPYEYQVTVQSETNIPGAVVRVYLGPKHDYYGKPISISQHRHHFVELDQFTTDLQQGQNVVTRNSQQAPGHSFDYPSIQEIKQRVNGAVRSQEPFYVSEPYQIFGFPARLSIPKGRQEGYPLQLLVVISQPGQQHMSYGPVIPEQFQTYNTHEFQVVGTDEYPQQIQQQSGKVVGVKPTVEVAPENLPIGQQTSQAVRNHYANLYTVQHGHYPYTHIQYNVVGQGQSQSQVQGQQYYGQPGHQTQQRQYTYQGQQGQHVGQGQQGTFQGYHYVQEHQYGQTHGYQGQGQVQRQGQEQGQGQGYSHTQGQIGNVGVVGVQGVPTGTQGVHGVGQGVGQGVSQGVGQGVPQDTQGIHGIQQGKYHTTYQGQSQQAQGLSGIGYQSSGQYHAGGYQGVFSQGQKVQDGQVSEYFQNKHIGEIIGGAISLDGKPFGYPLDRPLTPGALNVPNVHVQTVLVYHHGQPTCEVYYQ